MKYIHRHSFSDKMDYYAGYREDFLFAKYELGMTVSESENYADLLFEVYCRLHNEYSHSKIDFMIMDFVDRTYYDYTELYSEDLMCKELQRKHSRGTMLHKQGRIRTLTRKPKEKIYTRKTKTHSYRDAWGENERYNIKTIRQPQMWDGHRIVRKRTAKLARLR